MKKLMVLAAALLPLCSLAKDGDWTNFIYITCYGTSLYWTATDAFDGGTGSNAFNHAQGVLCNESNVFVIDTGNDRVVKLGYHKTVVFTPEPSNIWQMYYVSEWGGTGSGSNQFNVPTDACFGVNGLLYVVDSLNHCVKAFDTGGAYQFQFGEQGTASNQLNQPTGICMVPTNGNVIVANYGNSNIVEFTCSGEYVRCMMEVPNYPNTPAIESVHYERILGPYDVLVINSNVYITEAGRSDASQYKSKSRVKGANDANRFVLVNYDDFNYIADWNLPETNVDCLIGGWTGNVMQGIRGLVDFEGMLMFACADNSQSQYIIADELGYIVGKFGTEVLSGSVAPSPLEGQFAYPYNLARYSNFVFCADSGNNRVQMWKANTLPVFDYPKTNWFEVRELQVLSFTVHAKDDDGDTITYSGALTPAGDGKNWGVNSDYMKFSMIPKRGDAGTDFVLALTASDGFGSASMSVTIHVNPVNPHHPKLVAGKPGLYEDWVFDAADDGDLIAMKFKGTINHWDGSVLDISGAPTLALSAKRAKTLAGTGYDTLYGEIDATNEYALQAVAQLDELRSQELLKSVKLRGSVGRIILPENVALGSVTVYGGCLGGADAMTIKKISVVRGKLKNPVTKAVRTHGGDISGHYYPGGYGHVRAFGADTKGVSIASVACAGGNLSNAWIRAIGHIMKVALKLGKDENKLPIGGTIAHSIVRAGIHPVTSAPQATGDVASVKAADSIVTSSVMGAADPGANGFEGTAIDPTETYLGSVKKLAHGASGGLVDALIVSRDAIKKLDALVRDTNTIVIINGIVQ